MAVVYSQYASLYVLTNVVSPLFLSFVFVLGGVDKREVF